MELIELKMRIRNRLSNHPIGQAGADVVSRRQVVRAFDLSPEDLLDSVFAAKAPVPSAHLRYDCSKKRMFFNRRPGIN